MRCQSCASDLPESSRFCLACGASLDSASSTPTRTVMQASEQRGARGSERFAPGTILAGRYRIVGLLGRGGMGEVYRADDLKLGHPVALKFLPQGLEAEPGRQGRFLNEVRLALKVTHRNVCRVHDIGETDGQQFLSMEYVDGENLASLLRRIGRFPRDRAIRVARQLCGGLAAAHEQGILHRDLKPANVMIDGRGQVKVTDFGLAGIATEMEGPQARLGTPAYMAPEQFEGREVTVRSDVYALGLVLYELFTGRPAFEARTPEDLAKRQRETTPVSPASHVDGLDPSVEKVILRCLESDPRLRPASALAVAAALPGGDPIGAALAAGETPSPELLAEAGEAGGLRPALAWAGLVAFLAGVVLIVLLGKNVQLVTMVPLNKPPDALSERAREIARGMGYEEAPADSLHAFLPNEAYLRHLQDLGPRSDTWAPLRRSQPAGLLFWYRQSPEALSKISVASVGDWFSDPPNLVPGMLQMALDTEGRLQSFAAVPPERPGTGGPQAGPEWGPQLAAAGLNPASLREVAPSWSPPVFADQRIAWEGVYPDAPDVTIHVEAASYLHRPVWFRIHEPWTEPSVAEGPPKSAASRVSEAVFTGVFLLVLIGAAIIALRNIRLGRGDRRTALRFALYLGGVRMLWLLGAHHVPTAAELDTLMGHFAYAMQRVGLVWLFYIALEPYARRLWPRMLVSWVRLFGGRLRDPLVGRDLLVGAVAGAAFGLNDRLIRSIPGWLGLSPALPLVNAWNFEALRGLRHAMAATVVIHTISVLDTFIPIMLFLVLRVLFRRTWPAVAIVSLAGAIGFYPRTGSAVVYIGLILFVLLPLFWIVLFRFGLLSLVACMSIRELLTQSPITFDLSAWYAGAGVPALVLVFGVTIWAFRTSVAGRPLFRDEILEAQPSGSS